MSYIKASELLPMELLLQIQEYVDGQCVYIPKIEDNKCQWGSKTTTREELKSRNSQIYND